MGMMCSFQFCSSLWIIISLSNICVKCYRTGAGPQSCSSMVPFHNNVQPQKGPVPYTISVSKTSYTPREQIVGKFLVGLC